MKKTIIAFLCGIIFSFSINVLANILINASEVEYEPDDTTWHVEDVKTALDELYADATCKNRDLNIIYASAGNGAGTRTYTFQDDYPVVYAYISGFSRGNTYIDVTSTVTTTIQDVTELNNFNTFGSLRKSHGGEEQHALYKYENVKAGDTLTHTVTATITASYSGNIWERRSSFIIFNFE